MAVGPRRKAVVVDVGGVKVGGNHPIVVQSMTNTDTADVASTVNQVMALARAGSELVRVTVNTEQAAAAVPRIVETIAMFGVPVPIIGDFHYNGHILLKKYPECARKLAKYRINPGNSDIGRKTDDNFRTMIEVAIENRKPVRIGVNWGSLDSALLTRMMDENSRLPEPKDARLVTLDAMVASAMQSAQAAERHGLGHDRIILSAKVSGVQDLIDVYRALAAVCDYPLHLGLTEAGMGSKGIVASTAALAPVLQDGIGDTIRTSLTPLPNGDRTEEVIVVAADSAIARHPQFHPAGDRVPGVRPHHQHVLPGDGRPDSDLPARRNAQMEGQPPGRGDHEGRGDGLRGERARGIQTLQHRHLAAGHVRRAQGAGIRGRPADDYAEGRPHCGRNSSIS